MSGLGFLIAQFLTATVALPTFIGGDVLVCMFVVCVFLHVYHMCILKMMSGLGFLMAQF